jgi:hypothetical protein
MGIPTKVQLIQMIDIFLQRQNNIFDTLTPSKKISFVFAD